MALTDSGGGTYRIIKDAPSNGSHEMKDRPIQNIRERSALSRNLERRVGSIRHWYLCGMYSSEVCYAESTSKYSLYKSNKFIVQP
jgi:hypothetical protein